MQILQVLFVIFVIGVGVYFLQQFPWINDQFKTLITWLAIVLVVIWVLLIVASWLGMSGVPAVWPMGHR
jgi:hypothetical protein